MGGLIKSSVFSNRKMDLLIKKDFNRFKHRYYRRGLVSLALKKMLTHPLVGVSQESHLKCWCSCLFFFFLFLFLLFDLWGPATHLPRDLLLFISA